MKEYKHLNPQRYEINQVLNRLAAEGWTVVGYSVVGERHTNEHFIIVERDKNE